jgi:hypothetical protein
MRSIVIFLESLFNNQQPEPLQPPPIKPNPVKIPQRLSPQLINLMRKDKDLATQVAISLKNSENIGKMRSRHLINT